VRIRSPRDLGLRLRERRKELGLTQAELGSRVGATRFWVMDVERGKPGVELELVLRAATALGMSLDLEPADAGARVPQPAGLPRTDLAAMLDGTGDDRTPLRPARRRRR
jgi:HTH-type transcriptional regulator / antitoxin HipB